MVQQKQEYNSSMWMIMMTLMMLVVLGLLYYIYTMRKEYVVKCMTLKCPIPEQQQQQQQQITAQAPPTPPTPPFNGTRLLRLFVDQEFMAQVNDPFGHIFSF